MVRSPRANGDASSPTSAAAALRSAALIRAVSSRGREWLDHVVRSAPDQVPRSMSWSLPWAERQITGTSEMLRMSCISSKPSTPGNANSNRTSWGFSDLDQVKCLIGTCGKYRGVAALEKDVAHVSQRLGVIFHHQDARRTNLAGTRPAGRPVRIGGVLSAWTGRRPGS